jgi:cell division septation protein DedD
MSITLRPLVLAVATLIVTICGAHAWAREPAPVEFANRAERPAAARVQWPRPDPFAARLSSLLNRPKCSTGMDGSPRAHAQPPLDLRGTLRAGAPSDLLGADAFDEVPAPAAQTDPVRGRPSGNPLAAGLSAATVEAAEPPALSSGAYYVQVGAFADPSNAERVRTALLDVGVVSVDVREGPSVTLHRVRLGQWASRGEAELVRDMIAERGFTGAVVALAH